MTIEELKQLATKADIKDLYNRITFDMQEMFSKSKQKEFYKPKEFAELTGIKYSTVIYYCNTGRLKARHDGPKKSWVIHHSELERYASETIENKR